MALLAFSLAALAWACLGGLAVALGLFFWGVFGTARDADHEDDDMRGTGIGA